MCYNSNCDRSGEIYKEGYILSLAFTILTALSLLVGRGAAQPPGRAENWVQRIVIGNQREIDRNPRLQALAADLFDAARALDGMNPEAANYTPAQQDFAERISEFVRARGGPNIRIRPVGHAQKILPPYAFGS